LGLSQQENLIAKIRSVWHSVATLAALASTLFSRKTNYLKVKPQKRRDVMEEMVKKDMTK